MNKKIALQRFIPEFRKIHGKTCQLVEDTFSDIYSLAQFICRKHGAFNELPSSVLRGLGCSYCISEKQFIEKAIAIHGYFYDYSKVRYFSSELKVTIICQVHGKFRQTPANHINRKCGCPECGRESQIQSRKSTTEEFIPKARAVHGDKYGYEKVIYVNNWTKIIITCPIHGDFKQKPQNHLHGKGCRRCSESKGELYIAKVLSKYNINFVREYQIPGATPRYRYDFYLPSHNVLIEFHGGQHFKSIEHFGGEEAFKQIQFRDKVKYSLAKECGYKIVYFDYRDMRPDNFPYFENKICQKLNIS